MPNRNFNFLFLIGTEAILKKKLPYIITDNHKPKISNALWK